MDGSQPSEVDLSAYRAGTLPPRDFDRVDRWIASLPEAEQVRVLDAATQPASPSLGAGAAQGGVLITFASEAAPSRYENIRELGRGGMGSVWLVRDRTLNRDVALKRLRPRGLDEPMDAYLVRLRAFRREATLTASLEHPGIVPVHDVGVAAHEAPAFVMKKLDGSSLADLLAAQPGSRLPASRAASIVQRVAEAIAYAHAHGVVHRDLKPANVIVGDLGAVSVIDWGLAASVGAEAEPVRAGTPAWMAPEQSGGIPADPRCDVFGLGAVLMAALTGTAPRSAEGVLDLTPLDRGVPIGLSAVVRRCLEREPARRYANGSDVADELGRWLLSGLTVAQEPSLVRRAVAGLRRHPAALSALGTVALAAVVIAVLFAWHHAEHRAEFGARLADLDQRLPLDDREALLAAQGEVAEMIEHDPGFDRARLVEARIRAALETIEAAKARADVRQRLTGLVARYRQLGPSKSDVSDLTTALRSAGLRVAAGGLMSDVTTLASSPLRDVLLPALVRLEHALLQAHIVTPLTSELPQLLDRAGGTSGWRALGSLLREPRFSAHDLVFPDGPDGAAALAEADTADEVLALYGPDTRLVSYARDRIASAPGAFWPRVILAQAALRSDDSQAASQHAWVALGAEPSSLWPHLVLAYRSLHDGDNTTLAAEVAAGDAINPDHAELAVLRAVALAHAGQVARAQEITDHLDAGHLRFHLEHPSGHPMERSVAALVDAGIKIPDAPAEIGPLVPHQH
jgi:tRNA A-37 threonylcarbamoyl transferase component Bud32